MTRINVGVDPSELSGPMLIAEHRELKRIPNQVKQGKFSLQGQPQTFTLGPGHVKFFYDKLGYLKERYELLYAECLRRGYQVTWFGGAWDGIDPCWMGAYQPTPEAEALVRARIQERMAAIAFKKSLKKSGVG